MDKEGIRKLLLSKGGTLTPDDEIALSKMTVRHTIKIWEMLNQENFNVQNAMDVLRLPAASPLSPTSKSKPAIDTKLEISKGIESTSLNPIKENTINSNIPKEAPKDVSESQIVSTQLGPVKAVEISTLNEKKFEEIVKENELQKDIDQARQQREIKPNDPVKLPAPSTQVTTDLLKDPPKEIKNEEVRLNDTNNNNKNPTNTPTYKVHRYNNGDVYLGEWLYGEHNGRGSYIDSNGDKYSQKN
eukprot:NODE_6467_length_882_cov_38.615283_g5872_i0.p1 GENE.NODE_6467_length_882_cov_38.615283_g5872_i0~~NODE_6467_length_882_cov_38.615283_g5872_i0.p1  ORF type:complete len:244 (+),score=51.73 NODE_6467_length_882_cov_38.615283_g5872_i0:60-791(+)